jgi:hypothetical protein
METHQSSSSANQRSGRDHQDQDTAATNPIPENLTSVNPALVKTINRNSVQNNGIGDEK